jgi:hypothetical protein
MRRAPRDRVECTGAERIGDLLAVFPFCQRARGCPGASLAEAFGYVRPISEPELEVYNRIIGTLVRLVERAS